MKELAEELRPRDTKIERKKGFALLFRKGSRWWLAHLWSNQVSCWAFSQKTPPKFAADRLYRYVLPARARLETHGFYDARATFDEERKKAIACFSRLVIERLSDGFEFFADSRQVARERKAKVTRRPGPGSVSARPSRG